jgi:hypothetical protein
MRLRGLPSGPRPLSAEKFEAALGYLADDPVLFCQVMSDLVDFMEGLRSDPAVRAEVVAKYRAGMIEHGGPPELATFDCATNKRKEIIDMVAYTVMAWVAATGAETAL